MKVSDNRAISVMELFRKELEGPYSKEEIETFLFYSLNEYAGFSRSDMALKKETRFSESELLKFFRVIRKLKQYVPIQYILGHTEFYGLKLRVNESVLISRPETEELVEWIVSDVTSSVVEKQSFNILDIGTGSGCIAIALKKNISQAKVSALDISEKALELAKQNARENNVEIQFIHGDILNTLTHEHLNTLTPDLIVSNPPYIAESEKSNMNRNVLDHEPHTALFVPDNNPLLFYRIILDFAKEKLYSKGKVYFELNNKYADDVAALARSKGFVNCIIKKDLSGNERMFRCEKNE